MYDNQPMPKTGGIKFLVSSFWIQWNLEMIGVCGFEPTNSKLKYNDSFEQTMKWQNTPNGSCSQSPKL